MTRQRTGWMYVAAQAALLITIVTLPGGDEWPTPLVLRLVGLVVMIGGLALVVAAALRLGPGLTPNPAPTDAGQLITTGFYRYVRHPIYSGVLAAIAGLTLRSGSVVVLVTALLTLGFFIIKSRWEEQRLVERYGEAYTAYAATTPRFVPRLQDLGRSDPAMGPVD